MHLEAGVIGRVIALPMASADSRPKPIVPPRPCSLSQSAGSVRPGSSNRPAVADDRFRLGAGHIPAMPLATDRLRGDTGTHDPSATNALVPARAFRTRIASHEMRAPSRRPSFRSLRTKPESLKPAQRGQRRARNGPSERQLGAVAVGDRNGQSEAPQSSAATWKQVPPRG